MTQRTAREFPIEWPNAADADKLWAWDAMHCPRPLTPLSVDFVQALSRAAFDLSGAPNEGWTPPLFVNGFMYDSFTPPDSASEPEPWRKEREERIAAQGRQLRRLWSGRWLPRIKRISRFIRETDVQSMQAEELVEHLATCILKAGLAFGVTLYAAEPMFLGVEQLYRFCEAELGAQGVALAGASIQGYANESASAEAALSGLAGLAKRLGLFSALEEAGPHTLSSLDETPEGREFLGAFEKMLDRFGWRTPNWFELSQASWREEPTAALHLIGQYLRKPAPDPVGPLMTAGRGRRAALRRLRAALSEPEKRERFEEVWRMGRQFVPVSEGRALWQLSLSGFLRVPALALGRRLAGAGAVRRTDDIFYLRLDDLRSGSSSEWAHLVESRRQERERWWDVVPPLTLGDGRAFPPAAATPDGGPAELPFGARMISGFSVDRSREEGVLKGNAASPGLATGTARVLHSVGEGDRVQPGDILICRFTTPSWSHLFSRVSAVVADAGGVLSHCAILAREYAIPCVAGVRAGTRRISDGMRITVDGNQGIVLLDR